MRPNLVDSRILHAVDWRVAVAAAAVLALPALAGAAPSSEPASLRSVKADPAAVDVRLVTGGTVTSVALGDTYAYLNVADRLVPLDIRNPSAPVEVGSPLTVSSPVIYGSLPGLVVRGSVAYAGVGGYYGGLMAIDLADPLKPCCGQVVQGSADGAVDVALDGDRAWVLSVLIPHDYARNEPATVQTTWSTKVDLYDLGDPLHPRLTASQYNNNSGADAVAAKGKLYVAVGSAGATVGVDVYDLVNGRPAVIGGISLGQPAYAVDTDGDRLFVAANTGVFIFDLADPTNPQQMSMVPTSSPASSLAVSGVRLVVGTDAPELLAFDISNPAAPVALGSLPLPVPAQGIALRGDNAYVALGGGGFRIFNFLSGGNPSPLANMPGVGSSFDAAVDGDTLFAALGSGTVAVIDRSVPGVYPLLSSTDWGLSSIPVAAGGYVYGLDGATLRVIDARDPTSLQRVGEMPLADLVPSGVTLAAGGCLAVSSETAGLRTIDVSNPAQPAFAGSVGDAQWRLLNVLADGRYVYTVDGNHGLRVFDVANCAQPRQVAEIPYGQPQRAMALVEETNQLYLGTYQAVPPLAAPDGSSPQPQATAPPPVPPAQALVVNVGDSLQPREVGTWPVPGDIRGLAAAGGWVHAAYFHTRIGLFKQSVASRFYTGVDVQSPQLFDAINKLAAADDSLYVATGGAGLMEMSYAGVRPDVPPITPTPTGSAPQFRLYVPVARDKG